MFHIDTETLPQNALKIWNFLFQVQRRDKQWRKCEYSTTLQGRKSSQLQSYISNSTQVEAEEALLTYAIEETIKKKKKVLMTHKEPFQSIIL